jgi:hypothetical protein
VPLPLRVCVSAAIIVLAVDAYFWFVEDETPWNWFVPVMNVAAIAFFSCLHLRRSWVRKWVRDIALVWGLFGCIVPFVDTLGFMDGSFSSASTVAVGVVLFATFVVLFLPSSRAYFSASPPNTSLERSRD